MTHVGSETRCSKCEFLFPEAKAVAEAAALVAQPCPSCGGFGLIVDVSIMETVTVMDGHEMQLKRVGVKKPVVESFSKPSLSRKLEKHVYHERLIDRENNLYHEKITDYQSGETIHEQKEPLTDHVGHGSAKNPAGK
ncbi:hypothetical protein [Hydrogenophaga sp.]|uniref:hypothetical protein n=1 Tax=Hydrogenophaga sp. TaxID=1904254 RepID=UPI003F6FADED